MVDTELNLCEDLKQKLIINNEDSEVYGHQRAKFEGFGDYGKYEINDRVNELMEALKKENPKIDNYLLWLCTVDYILREELNIEIDETEAKEMYEKFKEERNKFIYENVKIE